MKLALYIVEVLPLQAADLTAPQSCGHLRVEEVPPEFILVHLGQEDRQLLLGQDLLAFVVRLGRGDALRWVPWDQVGGDGILQRVVKHRVDAGDHSVAQLVAAFRVRVDAAFRFQLLVHFLDIQRCDLRNDPVPKVRLDVVFGVAAVTVDGVGPDCSGHILIQPCVQPLAKCHPAVLGQLHISIGVHLLMELVQ